MAGRRWGQAGTATVLDVVAGYDVDDPFSRRIDDVQPAPTAPVRIGVPTDPVASDVPSVFARAIERLAGALGADVVSVDLEGDRRLVLHHSAREGRLLASRDASEVLGYLADLWGYPVLLREVDEHGNGLREHTAEPRSREVFQSAHP